MLALIDADIVLNQTTFSVEKSKYSVYYKNEFVCCAQGKRRIKEILTKLELIEDDCEIIEHAMIQPFKLAKWHCNALMRKIIKQSKATKYKAILSSPIGWRKKKYSDYKANRKKVEKPIYYYDMIEYLRTKWKAVFADKGLEADDVLANLQYNSYTQTLKTPLPDDMTYQDVMQTIICSIDKDLKTIPGWHYNWYHNTTFWMTPEESNKFFWQQMLQGDVSDNIIGLKGIGPKRAEKILDNSDDYKVTVKDLYHKEFEILGEYEFNKNVELLTLGNMVHL